MTPQHPATQLLLVLRAYLAKRKLERHTTYMAGYMLRRYHTRRGYALQLLGGCCARPGCGRTDDLEFDHIDPSQKALSMTRMWSVAWPRFLAELQKCQLLCKAHHIDKHRTTAPCGTVKRYWAGCRCDACTNANLIYTSKKHRRGWWWESLSG